MGYAMILKDNQQDILLSDFEIAMNNLERRNKGPLYPQKSISGAYITLCDTKWINGVIHITGSFSMSGDDVEGYALNLLLNLQKLNYIITIESTDFYSN